MDRLEQPPRSERLEKREWTRASAREMRAALDAGTVSSRELVDAHLERIQELDEKVTAFAEVFVDEARRDADRMDQERRAGEATGALHGLPVTVKECFDFAGRATTLGLATRREDKKSTDSVMVRTLRAQGAVILGRGNLAQLMFCYESENPLFGRTANPFSLRHSPGGSSGGDAAALASGMTPLAVGSDFGGSIRVPAHMCGVAGLLPTAGRWPNQGISFPRVGTRVIEIQPGPMARSAADVAFFFSALDPVKLHAIDPFLPPVRRHEPKDPRSLRVGFYTEDGLLPASSAVVGAVERAADALQALGVHVTRFTPPNLQELFFEFVALASADGGREIQEALVDSSVSESLKPIVDLARMPGAMRKALAQVSRLTGDRALSRLLSAVGEKDVYRLNGIAVRLRELSRELVTALANAELDALLCPPYAVPAVPHGMSGELLMAASYSAVFNAAGFPAGVVPVTRVRASEARRVDAKGRLGRIARRIDEQSAGLPVGVQVVAPPWHDETVLTLMTSIERNVAADVDFPATPHNPD